ncbi:hypothetical protein [Methylobacterium durans]|uniref:Uncharacterized protein n=1 Tax=Methylobacterium durans TaxID=2202825 RepID=A0A2U8WBQ7_9HYPH|nr:hypothetical protein [Methylobacterium durans]AWN43513.1 hypothetical protein DK389_27140 [Methylobacterium durans]
MKDAATRAAPPETPPPLLNRFAPEAPASSRTELWQVVPLECAVCALAVIAAAGLKLAGWMP